MKMLLSGSVGFIGSSLVLPLYPSDVSDADANVDYLVEQSHYQSTTINDCIQYFIDWYLGYFSA
ncbi:MAG: hypothetical protein ACI88A_004845 [Paraglaciecola sp.]|jgi:hypothetical protein